MKSLIGKFTMDQLGEVEELAKLQDQLKELKTKHKKVCEELQHYKYKVKNLEFRLSTHNQNLELYKKNNSHNVDKVAELTVQLRRKSDVAADFHLKYNKIQETIVQIHGEAGLKKILFYMERR